MIELIEELISDNRLEEAKELIKEELKKSYDFSKATQMLRYDLLTGFQVLIALIENDKGSDSPTLMLRLPRRLLTWVRTKEAISRLKVKKSVELFSKSFDTYIVIIDVNNIPSELPIELILPLSKEVTNKRLGYSFSLMTQKDQKYDFIIGFTKTEEFDYYFVENELLRSIDRIFEKPLEKVAIVISLDDDKIDIEFREKYYQLIIKSFISSIVQNSLKHKQTKANFSFLFQQPSSRQIFEKVLLKMSKPKQWGEEITQSTRGDELDEKFKQLTLMCSTKDPVYIKQLESLVNVIDEENVSLLIVGETGVGKTVLGKTIHQLSNRRDKPFGYLNCGGLNINTLVQQLWGWKKEAFTGAHTDYLGLIKQTEGGTLFFDEIDKANQDVRHEILTFVDTKEFRELKGDKMETADVRLIFGSNKDLEDMVRKGQFELDFYKRISRRKIKIPPLRERRGDIDLIISNLLENLNVKNGSSIFIEDKAISYLKKLSWPGNVRDLAFYIEDKFIDVHAIKKSSITLEQIDEYPPDSGGLAQDEDYNILIDLLRKFLIDWDPKKGKFLDEVITPLLSQLYIDICENPKGMTEHLRKASQFLGISGENHNSSTLVKCASKAIGVKEKLFSDPTK